MEVKSGYKQTEVGTIPIDWDVKLLGEIGEALIGLTYKPSDIRRHGTLVLRSSNIQDDSLAFNDNVFVETTIPDRIMVKPDDVLICVRNGSRDLIGKSALLDERTEGMTFGAFMAVYRSRIGRLSSYLFQSPILKQQIEAHLGATINQITNKSLNSFKIPLPRSEAEQSAITTTLSDVDELLGELDRLIAKKRDLKQAAMQQLLPGQTRLPGFKDEWHETPLDELFDFSGGYSASRDQLTSDEGLCYLHYGDIHGRSQSFIDVGLEYSRIPKIPVSLKSINPTSLLMDGDVVFVDASEDDDGTSKHVVIRNPSGIPFISGLHTIVAKPKTSKLCSEFLCYCFQSAHIKNQFRILSVGTKVKGINKTTIKLIRLKFPSQEEQEQIGRVLLDMDAELDALTQRREKTRALKQGMMQQLLTGKVRLV